MAFTLGKAVMAAPGRVANALSVECMSPEAKFFAHLSNVAYTEPAERPLHQSEFDLDAEFNMDRFVVYTRGWLRVKAVIIAFRGTATLRDLLDDVQLATNTNMTRLKQLLSSEVDCITALARKYPGARIHVTGHSLGGSMAMFVTAHTGLVWGGHIFNPGAGFKAEEILLGAVAVMLGAATGSVLGVSVAAGALACGNELSHESYGVGLVQELTSRINVHHVLGDPLSMLFTLGNVFCYTPTKVNLHALANFLDADVNRSRRARSVDCIRKVRTHRATSIPRRHSHSGTGGWTEVVRQEGNVVKSLVERLSRQANDNEETWSSALDVGSMVEVLAHAGTGRVRSWVQAEVVLAREKTLTLKWCDSCGAGEMLRRVARVSTEMRPCSGHNDCSQVSKDDEIVCTPYTDRRSTDYIGRPLGKCSKAGFTKSTEDDGNVVYDSSSCLNDSVSWHSALKVGSVAEVLVKQQWVCAEVVIARGKVLTMKWIDKVDGEEVLRRVARDSTELRPHEM